MARRIPPPAASYEQELLTAARKVATLMAKRRRYRKLLRELDADLRHERKLLKAVANRTDDRRPDVMPSRLTGGATGYSREAETDAYLDPQPPRPTDDNIAETFVEAFDLDDDPVADLVAADPTTRRQK